MDNILINTHDSIIPLFHDSMVETKSQASKVPYVFISCKNLETLK
jgi:hypothetical protein